MNKRDDILSQAIKKATANGWKYDEYYDGGYPYYMLWQHGFAKALWGEEHYDDDEHEPVNWAYHLQQMVLAKDPIEYLGKNLK